jgi:hypothetical protein
MYLVLLVFKWTLNAIKEFDLGTDALVWATDRIRLEFGPIEDLIDRLIQWSLPVQIPAVPEVTRGWMMGQVTTQIRDCVWQLHGLNPATYLPFAMAEAEILTADEVLELAMRRGYDVATVSSWMYARGWVRNDDLQGKLELFWELPTIQDHLHWLARNVDDTAYVEQYGLLDGFAPDQVIRTIPQFANYTTLNNPTGRDFWARYGPDLMAQGMKIDYAASHYAAHWIQPSPEQLREFVYRLRPGNPAGNPEFTANDFDRILSEQDYAPLARQWFGNTIYRVPALTYIIGMYRQNVITDGDLANYHQDLGFTAADSERFVGVDSIQKRQMRTRQFDGWTPAAIGTAYAMGQLGLQDVHDKMTALGAQPDEIDDLVHSAQIKFDRAVLVRARSRQLTRTISQVSQGLSVGSLDAADATNMLMGLGFPADRANAIVQTELASGRIVIVKQSVSAIKRQYFGGWINGVMAEDLLQGLGINQDKIDEYIALWNLVWNPVRKRRTASQIVGDVANGMMDTNEALFRLANLGYDQADSILFLADAQRKIVQRQAQAQAAALRTQNQAAAQQARLARQAAAQAKALMLAARQAAPRNQLIKWLRKGTIAPPEFMSRMADQGYNLTDSRRYAADATIGVTRSTLDKWLRRNMITASMYTARALALGLSPADITVFINTVNTVPKMADLLKWVTLKILDQQGFTDELVRSGYSVGDIARYIQQAFPTPPPTTTSTASGSGGGTASGGGSTTPP